MSGTNKYLLTLVIGLVAASLSSCGSPSAQRNPIANSVAMAASTPNSNGVHVTPQPLGGDRKQVINATFPNRETITIYTSDGQCQALIPKKVSVSAEHAGLAAVGKILEAESTADLSLAGYRVNVDKNSGIATVDLRTTDDSKWHLTSLSNCEQFALFGSLRKTLTGNAQWKIKDVHFTERGKEISL